MMGLWTAMRLVWPMIRGYRARTVWLLVLMFISGLSEFIGLAMLLPLVAIAIGEPLKMGGRVGEALKMISDAPGGFTMAAVALVVAIAIKAGLTVYLAYERTRLSMDLRLGWAERIFMSALRAPLAKLSRSRVGELVEAVSTETQQAGHAVGGLLLVIQKLVLSAMLVTGLLIASPWLTLGITGVCLAILGLLKLVGVFRSIERGKRMVNLSRKIANASAETVANARQIKVLDAYAQCAAVLRQSLAQFAKARIEWETANQVPASAIELGIVGCALIALVVVHQNSPESLRASLPVLALFVAMASRLVDAIGGLSSQMMKMNVAMTNLHHVARRIADEDVAEQLDRGAEFGGIQRQITLENVHFAWPDGAVVLRDATMEFKRGSVTALVGASGRGKSTTAALLAGLLNPDSGQVLMDGVPLGGYSLRSVRRQVGYVTQEVELFYGTIADNLRMGRPDATDSELRAAATAAHADAFIAALPQGYETMVGERGATLSGGQRQRIALARALLRSRTVYIFDEATSALDEETQALIQATVREMAAHAAVVVIAHRPSAIRGADRVYRLEEDGSATELTPQAALAAMGTEG